jgi:hypothetical protein
MNDLAMSALFLFALIGSRRLALPALDQPLSASRSAAGRHGPCTAHPEEDPRV